MQAMILAAGFGTRLLPYTKLRPKPLFPLLNEPLLLLTIRHLQHAGFDHIIVNCHYLKEQIVDALHGMEGVVVQEEDRVLGTGGGLRMALASMRDEPILVTNGDIYHSVDYLQLLQAHKTGGCPVTMAMHDYPRFNKVAVDRGMVTGFGGEGGDDCLAFTGLHVLEPQVLCAVPDTGASCIIDRYRALLHSGGRIRGYDVSGCSWTDMGTVEDYLDLHGQLLRNDVMRWPEFVKLPQQSCLFQEQMKPTPRQSFLDWACVGRVELPQNLTLQRCVVWDGAALEEGGEYADALLVPGQI